MELGALVPSIVGTRAAASARLDSITLGSAYQGIPHLYWFTAGALGLDPATSTIISLPILQPEETGVTAAASSFQAQPVEADKAAKYGGNSQYVLPAIWQFNLAGPTNGAPRAWLCEHTGGLGDGTPVQL